jgi:diadenosine tetraphosphate (Ap4A) HIT family hydrolase
VSDKKPGSYDDNNIFARILRGEIPATRLYEDEHVLAIADIHPQAPTHILVMPKGRYVSFDDFSANAGDDEIIALTRATGRIAREAGVAETGYRLIFNHGPDSHQEVPHLHIHILGGRPLGHLLQRNI